MKRQKRNAVTSKQEILEKSAPVFNTYGYAGTSMKMLVEATGFQMGGIYRHFNSKSELGLAVFTYNYETLLKRNLDFPLQLDPREKLLYILDRYRKMFFNPAFRSGCPILNTAVEVDDTNEEYRLLAKSFIQEILTILTETLEEGKKKGLFLPSLDSHKEALFLFSSFEGAIFIGKAMKKPQAYFDVLDRLEDYLRKQIFSSISS
ncbi:MAG: TetR/AcrR family transcriptional regulator [Bacteroidota bacterium]